MESSLDGAGSMNEIAARKLNTLVLDDDPSIVRLVTHLLQDRMSQTLEVTGLTDPVEAQQWIDQHCCDILISDIEMPQMDGLSMLIFAKRRNAWTQVIFMTAHSTWDRITEALENGASDYLLKPIDGDELVDLVTQQCARFTRWQSAVSGTIHK